MKMIHLLFVVLVTVGSSCVGREILSSGFEDGGLDAWTPKKVGQNNSPPGIIAMTESAHTGRHAVWISTPEKDSWAFLRKDFQASGLKAKKFRLSAWVLSNNNNKARLLISAGTDVWGDGILRAVPAQPESAFRWERLSVVLEPNPQETVISIAAGLDYGSPGSWMLVDDIAFEAVENADTAMKGEHGATIDTIPHETVEHYGRTYLTKLNNAAAMLDRWGKMDGLPEAMKKGLATEGETLRKSATTLDATLESKSAMGWSAWSDIKKTVDASGRYQYVIWQGRNMSQFNSGSNPGTLKPAGEISVHAAMNEKEGALVLIRNNTSRSQYFQLKVEDVSEDRKWADKINIRTMIPVENVPDNMPLIGDQRLIMVGACETYGIWLTVDTKHMQAGTHHAKFCVNPLDPCLNPIVATMDLTVYPLRLPDQMSINVFNWDYSSSESLDRLNFLLDARVNTFHITTLPPLLGKEPFDFSSMAKSVGNIKKCCKSKFTLVFEVWSVRKGGWKPEFDGWLRGLVECTKKLGLDYGDWYLYIYDEDLSAQFLASAKAVKAIDPKVRIFSDKIDTADIVKKFVPYLGMWCPLATEIGKYPEAFSMMKASGAPIWAYLCGSTPVKSLASFRLLPWHAFKYKLQGCCYWTSSPCALRSEAENFGMTYSDSTGSLVPSRRWIAWTDGLEDYLLLDAARNQAQKNNDQKLLAMIDNAVNDVLGKSGSPTELDDALAQWRLELLKALSPQN